MLPRQRQVKRYAVCAVARRICIRRYQRSIDLMVEAEIVTRLLIT